MNAVGVKLGNGWYGHEQGGYGKQNHPFIPSFFALMLFLNFRCTSSCFYIVYYIPKW